MFHMTWVSEAVPVVLGVRMGEGVQRTLGALSLVTLGGMEGTQGGASLTTLAKTL